jgi:hypothetical protein
MPIPGDELSAPVFDDGQGAKAIVLHLEYPVRMIKRLSPPSEGHRLVREGHLPIENSSQATRQS